MIIGLHLGVAWGVMLAVQPAFAVDLIPKTVGGAILVNQDMIILTGHCGHHIPKTICYQLERIKFRLVFKCRLVVVLALGFWLGRARLGCWEKV